MKLTVLTVQLEATALAIAAALAAFFAPPFAQAEPSSPSRESPKTNPASEAAELPLIIDAAWSGVVTAHPEDDPLRTRIEAEDLFRALAEIALPSVQALVLKSADAGWITVGRLRELGLDANYDSSQLVITLSVPPNLRKTQSLDLGPQTNNQDLSAPASTSFILNAYTTRSLSHEEPAARGLGSVNSLRSDLDGALNIGGVVLEAEGNYNEFATQPWRRGELRAVYDKPETLLRFSAGDLRTNAMGYRTFRPMGGLSVARDFILDPERITRPMSQYEINLRNPSRVDVVVNGVPVRTLNLPAGRFDIRDIPVGARVNEVRLIITDIYGRVDTVEFPFIAANELLQPGLEEFSYDFGFPSRPDGSHLDYDTRRPTFSAWHRRGFTSTLTLGAFAQGDSGNTTGGLEALTANQLGFFSLESAVSRTRLWPAPNFAARVAYRSHQETTGLRGPFAWGARAETRGRRFALFGDLAPDNRTLHLLDAFVNLRLVRRWNLTLGATQEWARAGLKDVSGAYGTLNGFLDDGLQLVFEVGSTRVSPISGRTESRAFVTLRWTDRNKPTTAAIAYDTRGATKRLEALWSGDRSQADVAIVDSDSAMNANANINALLQRIQLGYSLGAAQDKERVPGVPDTRSVSRFQTGTSLIMADGRFALSRPIFDSFALIGNGREEWQRGARVNPAESISGGEVSAWGPAVVADLNSYRTREFLVDTAPLDTGLTLKKERFRVRPRYRSGYRLDLEVNAVVIGQGRFWEPGDEVEPAKPAALVAGWLVRDGEEKGEFFSGRDGRFELQDLNPGEYELRFNDERFAPVRIRVESGSKGYYDFGDIRLMKKE